MVTLTATEAYATVEEADVYLELNTTWQDLEDEVKEDALMWGRYYIDSRYTCTFTTIPDEVKLANSILAADYTADNTVFDSGKGTIKKTKVKAGPVSTEKEYTTAKSSGPPSANKVDALLKSICTASVYGSSVFLVRA